MKTRYLLLAAVLGLGLTIVLLLLLTGPVSLVRADPGTYYVREGASGNCLSAGTPCGSVQQAINQATSGSDEIWVATGAYTENLVIVRGLSLRGGWNDSFTVQSPVTAPAVVDGGGSHVVSATVGTGSALIEGFVLRNGQDGIHILSGQVTVEQCIIRDMVKQGVEIDGGNVLISATQILTAQQGIEVDDGVVQVANVDIAHTDGEGLIIEAGGTVTFTASTIEDCTQQGIQMNHGHLWLFDNYIHNVVSDSVHVEGGTASIVSNTVRSTLEDGIDVNGTQVISGNLVTDIGDQGISVHDGASAIVNNTVYDTGGDGIHADDTNTDVEIRGNTVYSTGKDGIDTRGQSVVIASNTVYDTGNHGIYPRDNNSSVINNTVYEAGEDGIRARDGASTIVGNTVYDTVKDGIHTRDSCSNVEVSNNTIYSITDDGVDARGAIVLVNGNVISGCGDNGAKVEGGPGVFTVTNNIVVGSGDTSALVKTAAGSHNYLYHNTLVGSATGQQGTAISVTLAGVNVVLANNIVVSHNVGITATAGTSLVVSNTLLWGNGSDPIRGTGFITQAPLFVAPASRDYHLLPDSPAVDAGLDVGVLTDVDGDPRLSGPDVGADEVVQKVYLPLVMRAD